MGTGSFRLFPLWVPTWHFLEREEDGFRGWGSPLALAMPTLIPEGLKGKFFSLVQKILAIHESRKKRITNSHIAVTSFNNYHRFVT